MCFNLYVVEIAYTHTRKQNYRRQMYVDKVIGENSRAVWNSLKSLSHSHSFVCFAQSIDDEILSWTFSNALSLSSLAPS